MANLDGYSQSGIAPDYDRDLWDALRPKKKLVKESDKGKLQLSLVYFAMRWLHQSEENAMHMSAMRTMKYFVNNFLGELKLVFGALDPKGSKSNPDIKYRTIEGFPPPEEWYQHL